MKAISNQAIALQEAARLAREALAGADLAKRCPMLGLPCPKSDGRLRVPFLGREAVLTLRQEAGAQGSAGRAEGSGPAGSAVETLLVLHYLLHGRPVEPAGEWISFREFPGGAFYFEPFEARTTAPLVAAIGNDLERLRHGLARYEWREIPQGDLGAAINVFGQVHCALVYNVGDEELGPSAQILFDRSLKRVFSAEDAVALAGRVCFGLFAGKCRPCAGCGFCAGGSLTSED